MSNWTEGNIFINNIYLAADFYLNVYTYTVYYAYNYSDN